MVADAGAVGEENVDELCSSVVFRDGEWRDGSTPAEHVTSSGSILCDEPWGGDLLVGDAPSFRNSL